MEELVLVTLAAVKNVPIGGREEETASRDWVMLSWKRAEVLLALGVGDGIRSGVDVRVVVGWVV